MNIRFSMVLLGFLSMFFSPVLHAQELVGQSGKPYVLNDNVRFPLKDSIDGIADYGQITPKQRLDIKTITVERDIELARLEQNHLRAIRKKNNALLIQLNIQMKSSSMLVWTDQEQKTTDLRTINKLIDQHHKLKAQQMKVNAKWRFQLNKILNK